MGVVNKIKRLNQGDLFCIIDLIRKLKVGHNPCLMPTNRGPDFSTFSIPPHVCYVCMDWLCFLKEVCVIF